MFGATGRVGGNGVMILSFGSHFFFLTILVGSKGYVHHLLMSTVIPIHLNVSLNVTPPPTRG